MHPLAWPTVQINHVLSTSNALGDWMSDVQRRCFIGLVPFGYERVIEGHGTTVVQVLQKRVSKKWPESGFVLSKWVEDKGLYFGIGVTLQNGTQDQSCAEVVDYLVEEGQRVVLVHSFGAFLVARLKQEVLAANIVGKARYVVEVKG